jgi:Xaa-Pro dipeptidase
VKWKMELVLHPRSEIDSRIKKLQSSMGDLAGVILFNSVDMCYFSGTAQDGLVYIPRDCEPVVMIRKSWERAKEESPLDVKPQKSLKNLKADLGITSGSTIGLELDVLPYNNYSRLAKAMDGVSFVDISETIRYIRCVKSDFEIGLIKEAAKIVDSGIESVQDYLVEGMMEIEPAAKVEAVMRSMGHQGTVRFHRYNFVLPLGHLMAGPSAAVPSFVLSPTGGRGPSVLHPQGPGFKKIGRNEPILVDYAGVYNGYIADETRIFSLGAVSPELENAHLAAVEIEKTIERELRPGCTGKDLFKLSEETGRQLGYENYLGGPPGRKCGFVGHGVGLEIDEYPVIGPLDHRILPSMTIAVEPKMIYPGIGVVGIEDTYLTTANEAVRLTKLSQDIWRV